MTKENKKDFNAMMKNNKDMPKIQIVKDEKTIKKYGGTKMFFAPPDRKSTRLNSSHQD